MSELLTASPEPPAVVEDREHVIEVVSQAPILIIENGVVFSAAVTLPVPRTKPTRRALAALRAMFLSSAADAPPASRHYPPRRDRSLEQAVMVREMRRL